MDYRCFTNGVHLLGNRMDGDEVIARILILK